ncbi:hypothetical protein H6CHR_03240 [Variovorax sp. PBL-H6]|nr:hypothetical protein H6CHR_03240 [Variovorax sp. PBL-H6]
MTVQSTLRQTRASNDIQKPSFGTFAPGERCLYDFGDHVEEVIIVEGHGLHWFRDADTGGRDRRIGYLVQRPDDEETHFATPGYLLDLQERKRHLTLVWPPKKKAARRPRKAVSHG